MFIFTSVNKLLKQRNTYRLGMLILVGGTLLLPWSSAITGPIPPPSDNTTVYDMSGSGVGPGSGDDTATSDYCGEKQILAALNENSVRRIPIVVWLILLLALVLIYTGR